MTRRDLKVGVAIFMLTKRASRIVNLNDYSDQSTGTSKLTDRNYF